MNTANTMKTSASPRRVAIAGASGLVGQYILQGLLADDSVSEVHALGRRPLRVQHPELVEHVVDFAALPALPPLDELYLALGTTIRDAGSEAAFRAIDFGANLAVAKAALTAGVSRIAVVSAAGADSHSRGFYNRVKGELEEALAEAGCDALLIARPSLLLGNRAELGQTPRRAEQWATAIFGRLSWIFPLSLRPIEARRVAAALVTQLPSSKGHVILSSANLHRLGA